MSSYLDQVSNVKGHLVNLSVVELLNVTEHAYILGGDKVDSNTLTSETTTTTNAMDVVLPVGGHVVVDNKGHLLDIDPTSEEISGDEDTSRSRTELSHEDFTLLLLHVTVHGGDSEFTFVHLLSQSVDLPPGVTEDDGLGDRDSFVKIRKRIKLPLLPLDGNVELLDTLKSQLVLLDENPHGLTHELLGHLEDLSGHGSREEGDLSIGREHLEDLVDLVLETLGQHLIGLVEAEDLDPIGLERSPLDHVEDTTGSTNNDLDTITEFGHVITDVGASNTGQRGDTHVVAEGDHDFVDLEGKLTGGRKDDSLSVLDVRVEALEDGDGEGGGLSCARLGLSDNVMTLDNGDNGPLLDGGRTFEAIGVNTTEKLRLQFHVIEAVDDLVPVGLDLDVIIYGGIGSFFCFHTVL